MCTTDVIQYEVFLYPMQYLSVGAIVKSSNSGRKISISPVKRSATKCLRPMLRGYFQLVLYEVSYSGPFLQLNHNAVGWLTFVINESMRNNCCGASEVSVASCTGVM